MVKLTDRHLEARTMTDLGAVFARQGSLQAAAACYERWLAAVRELGDRDGEAQALGQLTAVRNLIAVQAAARSNARTAS